MEFQKPPVVKVWILPGIMHYILVQYCFVSIILCHLLLLHVLVPVHEIFVAVKIGLCGQDVALSKTLRP